MLTLLNSTQLNGTTPGPYWAWGSGVLVPYTESSATNTVFTFSKAVSIAQATTSGISDRLAYLSADPIPYAESRIAATRYANFSGNLVSDAQAFINPIRLAYQYGFDEAGSATALVNAVRWRLYFNKHIPALARTWEDAGKTFKISVTQKYAIAQNIGRSRGRLLDSVWLGQGQSVTTATAQTNPENIWFIRACASVSESVGTSLVVPDRIRQANVALYGNAYSALAPTYTRAGESLSDSWNAGIGYGFSIGNGSSSVLRYPDLVDTEAFCESSIEDGYMVRGMASTGNAIAQILEVSSVNEWNFMRSTGIGTSNFLQNVLIFTPMSGQPMINRATSNAHNRVYSWFRNEFIEAISTGDTLNKVYTDMNASDAIANALIDSEGLASRGVFMVGDLEPWAETDGTPLRIKPFKADNRNGIASLGRLVYAINLKPGNRAPYNRTYIVPYLNRVYVVESEDREVII